MLCEMSTATKTNRMSSLVHKEALTPTPVSEISERFGRGSATLIFAGRCRYLRPDPPLEKLVDNIHSIFLLIYPSFFDVSF